MDNSQMVDDDPERFQVARDGDHMMVPFQCDTCQFMNVRNRLPCPGSAQDALLLKCLRRVILDCFWSRERSTVQGNWNSIRKSMAVGQTMGMGGEVLPTLGPFPIGDCSGVAISCIMMERSLQPGKNAKTIQFETLRKTRSAHANYAHASCFGTGDTTMQDDGNGSRMSHAVSNSFWFKRFNTGCHRRMGDIWLPDKAASRYVIDACFSLLERNWSDIWERDKHDGFALRRVATAACLILAGYFGGLRGEEINTVDLGVTRKHWDEATKHVGHPHVPLMLTGKFKKQKGLKLFSQPLAAETQGGRKIQVWFHRLMYVLEQANILTAP